MRMNRLTGAEATVRMLQAHGVRHVFGLCGDTSLPLYDALFRLDHGITHILSRDERHAGYMADAYARVTGRPGVCEGPSGGGATYILPGVVEANESSIPLLALSTDIGTGSRGRFALTELDQTALFRPLTKWNTVVDRAADIPRTLRRAFREMTGGRPGAVHLGLPFDVQKSPLDDDDLTADLTPPPLTGPDPAMIAEAARRLRAAVRPVIVCGGGIHGAGACRALADLAEKLDIPVATTISGKGAMADSHPLCLGVVGSNGGAPETRALIDEADLVLLVGCRAGSVTTERWRHPAPGAAVILHIDVDPRVLGANYPTAAPILADARLALEALAAECARRPAGDAGGRVAAARQAKQARFEALAVSSDSPIRPERLIATLQDLLPDDFLVLADPGTPCPYLSAYGRQGEPGRRFMSNRAHGALGWSMGAVVGAAIGRPDAKCIAMMGDGSFAMSCGELETIHRLGLPVTIITISNAVFGWIKAGQRSGFDERYFSVDFTRTRHADVARAFGLEAWTVDHPADLRPILARAMKADGPTLVDVICQPLHEAAAPVSEWIA
jgi:acetolactate synthase-1/2/3 large subunit